MEERREGWRREGRLGRGGGNGGKGGEGLRKGEEGEEETEGEAEEGIGRGKAERAGGETGKGTPHPEKEEREGEEQCPQPMAPDLRRGEPSTSDPPTPSQIPSLEGGVPSPSAKPLPFSAHSRLEGSFQQGIAHQGCGPPPSSVLQCANVLSVGDPPRPQWPERDPARPQAPLLYLH